MNIRPVKLAAVSAAFALAAASFGAVAAPPLAPEVTYTGLAQAVERDLGISYNEYLARSKASITSGGTAEASRAGTFSDTTSQTAGGDGFLGLAGGFEWCSFGFNATLRGVPVNLTAGHCNPNGAPGTLAQPAAVGWSGYFQVSREDDADYGIVATAGPADASPFLTGLVRGPGSNVVIRGVAEPTVGMPVCKHGSRTGFTCGTITALDQSFTSSRHTTSGMFLASLCTQPGDSGGPIFSGDRAIGIVKASNVPWFVTCDLGDRAGVAPQTLGTPIGKVLSLEPDLQLTTG